jgi:hypothetical protein
MSKPLLGLLIGGLLGALDGLSAWFSPEARPMMMAIVTGSTLKGVVTGLLAGFIAQWRRSTALGILAGLAIGFALSTGVALVQGDHYLEIVLPGMLVGGLAGFATQRYPQHVGGGSARVLILAAVGATLAPLVVAATQTSPSSDALASLAPLVGRWTGTTEGQPGHGTVEREYERILNRRFVQARNRSTYPPQERNKKGETHEDVGVFSFDSGRKRIVLRQFHTEGFVNQYVLDPPSVPGKLVLVSEAIENIPSGWRARETYVFTGADQFDEIFELAPPGKDFEPYSRSRLTRAR